jgi:hypothetical protein
LIIVLLDLFQWCNNSYDYFLDFCSSNNSHKNGVVSRSSFKQLKEKMF